jgi:RNA polymerase sigma-70 factor, ECF subfamily
MNNSILVHRNDLIAYALVLSKNKSDAEDLVQEVFLKIYARMDYIENIKNLKPYLMSTLRNIYIDNMRRKAKRIKYQDYAKHSLFDNTEPSINNTESIVFKQDIYHCILKIKHEWREPFLLFYQGYGYDEIAEKMGLKVSLLRMRIFYARRELSNILRTETF